MAGERTSRTVLVSGPPDAGKTTLAKPLVNAFDFALLSKDDIMEPLFDPLGGLDDDLETPHRTEPPRGRISGRSRTTCPARARSEFSPQQRH